MEALDLVDAWDVPYASVAVVTTDGVLARRGEPERSYRIASIAKLLLTYAHLVAVEEGSVSLDEPAGREGATVRHLLSHAAGYAFDGPDPISGIARRRIYSNTGMELAAEHLAFRTGIPYADYLREAVLAPLGMAHTEVKGSPAYGVWSTLTDLVAFAGELLRPRLVAASTLAGAVRVQFPGLPGILPDVGRFDPCDFGLGFERNFARPQHWAGQAVSPETFGHFGGAGTFTWVDPTLGRGTAVVCLTDRDFGKWSLEVWPPLCDAIVGDVRGSGGA